MMKDMQPCGLHPLGRWTTWPPLEDSLLDIGHSDARCAGHLITGMSYEYRLEKWGSP
jgi:hypothetical protein